MSHRGATKTGPHLNYGTEEQLIDQKTRGSRPVKRVGLQEPRLLTSSIIGSTIWLEFTGKSEWEPRRFRV